MKKIYYGLIYLILIAIGILIFYFSGLDPLKIDLIIFIIIIYIIRKPLKSIGAFLFKKRIYRAILSMVINIIWFYFIFWLILLESPPFFLSMISFLIVAISLNFNKIFNNIASGAILLATEQIVTGDLIETQGVQGRVREITLNYVKIREFDGVEVVIPNSNVFGSSIVKFTHNKFKIIKKLQKAEFEKKRDYRRYINQLNKMINARIKTTIYPKSVELLGKIDPNKIDDILNPIFEKYTPIFEIKPDYVVDTTLFSRVRLTIYFKSNNPRLILNFIDSFLRDLLYQLYPDEIFENWNENDKKSFEEES